MQGRRGKLNLGKSMLGHPVIFKIILPRSSLLPKQKLHRQKSASPWLLWNTWAVPLVTLPPPTAPKGVMEEWRLPGTPEQGNADFASWTATVSHTLPATVLSLAPALVAVCGCIRHFHRSNPDSVNPGVPYLRQLPMAAGHEQRGVRGQPCRAREGRAFMACLKPVSEHQFVGLLDSSGHMEIQELAQSKLAEVCEAAGHQPCLFRSTQVVSVVVQVISSYRLGGAACSSAYFLFFS